MYAVMMLCFGGFGVILMIISVLSTCVCVQLCFFCVFLGVVLKIISVLSTVARAAMMVCADGFGVDFDDYLRVKYICVCSNDVRFLWFWEYV